MKFQIHNRSTVVPSDEFLDGVAACASQLQGEFAQAHEIAPPTVEAGGDTDPQAIQAVVLDDSDSPGALGYHDVDAMGRPVVFVFAKTTIQDGGSWTVTLSHELCEAARDASCTLWCQTPDGRMRAYEMCDAVEADSYVKEIGGRAVQVSNFVTPEYFFATVPPGTRTDHMDTLKGQVAPARSPGGYDIVVDTAGQPSQEFSSHMASLSSHKLAMKRHPSSRTARRLAAAASFGCTQVAE